jgi:hypothetical protein
MCESIKQAANTLSFFMDKTLFLPSAHWLGEEVYGALTKRKNKCVATKHEAGSVCGEE